MAEALRVHVLQEIAGGPGAECGKEVRVLRRRGEHDHGGVRYAFADLRRGRQAVTRQLDLEEADVRPLTERRRDRGCGIRRLGAQLESVLLKSAPHVRANGEVVVGQQDARTIRHWAARFMTSGPGPEAGPPPLCLRLGSSRWRSPRRAAARADACS